MEFSCRAMALRNNKQFGVAKMKQEVNANLRKSSRVVYRFANVTEARNAMQEGKVYRHQFRLMRKYADK